MPLDADVRHVIVVGGTFDPPHQGHVRLAAAARERVGGDWLLFIPAARSPLKATGPEASDADRMRMVELALAGVPRSAVWNEEIRRAASSPEVPSYTVETLRRLRELLRPEVEIGLLIGADQAVKFHQWREYQAILCMARPLVVLRAPLGTRSALLAAMDATGAWSGVDLSRWERSIIATDLNPVSSTSVREAIRAHGLESLPADWLAPAVTEFIRGRGLYRKQA